MKSPAFSPASEAAPNSSIAPTYWREGTSGVGWNCMDLVAVSGMWWGGGREECGR